MYDEGGFQSEVSANAPNASMMMLMFSDIFGNMAFQIIPGDSPTIPYMSLESRLYAGQMLNQTVAPRQIQTGSTAGTQNLQGGTTVTDASGDIRVSMGTTGGY
jgi:hypothetical protein